MGHAMQDKHDSNDSELIWLKAIAADQSERLAADMVKPSEDASVKCPPAKGGMGYEPTEAVVVPVNAGTPEAPEPTPAAEPEMPEEMERKTEDESEEPESLSYGEQVLVDRMDDLIAIMSDIRDRLSTTGGGDAVSSPQAVVPVEDAGTNLSSALLAALTITDGILATRK